MNPELRELYQSVILDHYKKPRNHGRPAGADLDAEGVNPLCGDHVHVYARVEGDRIAEVGFEGSGCAISTASASLMTEAVKGRTTAEADALYQRFHDVVTTQGEADAAGLNRAQRRKLEAQKRKGGGGKRPGAR